MDTSADVMVLSQPASGGGGAEPDVPPPSPPAAASPDHLEEFSSRLSAITSAYASVQVSRASAACVSR